MSKQSRAKLIIYPFYAHLFSKLCPILYQCTIAFSTTIIEYDRDSLPRFFSIGVLICSWRCWCFEDCRLSCWKVLCCGSNVFSACFMFLALPCPLTWGNNHTYQKKTKKSGNIIVYGTFLHFVWMNCGYSRRSNSQVCGSHLIIFSWI